MVSFFSGYKDFFCVYVYILIVLCFDLALTLCLDMYTSLCLTIAYIMTVILDSILDLSILYACPMCSKIFL